MFGIEMHSYDSLREHMHESDYIICVDSQKNAGNVTDFTGNKVTGPVTALYFDLNQGR